MDRQLIRWRASGAGKTEGAYTGSCRPVALASAALAALLMVGCTTVAPIGLSATGGGRSGGSVQPGSSSSGSGVAELGAGGASPQGAGAALAASAGDSGGAVASGDGTGNVTPGASAGVGPRTNVSGGSTCSHPVKIGLSYSTDEGALVASAGDAQFASDVATYAQQVQAEDQTIAAYVNAHGGLAGCQVQMVFHNFQTTGADGFSGESQTECADFAEDQHVFAVIPQTAENQTLLTCLAQHKTVEIYNTGEYWPSARDFSQYRGFLYAPDYINPFRIASFIDRWAAAGYFGHSTKVGILLADDGSGNDQYVVNTLWRPRLSAMGITPTVFTFKKVESYSQIGSTGSEFESAVLQFKSLGIDHVIMAPDQNDAAVLFTEEANSQQYYPRYALSTLNGALATWSTIPANERPGAVGISFWYTDLGLSGDTQKMAASNPASANRALCNSIYQGHTGSLPVSTVYGLCDDFFFLQAALKGASSVTDDTLLAGAERLGSALSSADGYANETLASGRYDGGTSVRTMTWDQSGGQWQYVTPPQAIP